MRVNVPLDDSIQFVSPRRGLHRATVERYREMRRAGQEPPALKAGRLPDGRLVVIDGNHRRHEFKPGEPVPIDVEPMEPREVFRRAVLENLGHGLPLTGEELEAAAHRLRADGFGDAQIAKDLRIPLLRLQRLFAEADRRDAAVPNAIIVRERPVPRGAPATSVPLTLRPRPKETPPVAPVRAPAVPALVTALIAQLERGEVEAGAPETRAALTRLHALIGRLLGFATDGGTPAA